MIKLSSGQPIKRNEQGERIFGHSGTHTFLLLFLICRHKSIAKPGEFISPWHDRPEVASGKISKDDYIADIYQAIDLVPVDILELVIKELLAQRRRYKPSKREMVDACRAAMQMQHELGGVA
jgi:hypothetical protein